MYRGKKVVVVMPAYNAARTLRQTYDEVREQQLVDLIILVDDRSRDDTVSVARALDAARGSRDAPTGDRRGTSSAAEHRATRCIARGVASGRAARARAVVAGACGRLGRPVGGECRL